MPKHRGARQHPMSSKSDHFCISVCHENISLYHVNVLREIFAVFIHDRPVNSVSYSQSQTKCCSGDNHNLFVVCTQIFLLNIGPDPSSFAHSIQNGQLSEQDIYRFLNLSLSLISRDLMQKQNTSYVTTYSLHSIIQCIQANVIKSSSRPQLSLIVHPLVVQLMVISRLLIRRPEN